MNEVEIQRKFREADVSKLLLRMQNAALALEDVARMLTALYPGNAEVIEHARQAEGAARMLDSWSDAVAKEELTK